MTVHLRPQAVMSAEVPGLAYFSAYQAKLPVKAPGLPETPVSGGQQALDQLFGYFDMQE